MERRTVADLSTLPEHAFGHATPQWWGVMMMILIEGTIFALCVASYFYLRLQEPEWPPRPIPMPAWFPGVLNLIVIGAGSWLMRVVERHALRMDRRATLRSLTGFMLLNATALILRGFEFPAFFVKWDTNAYGSIVWLTLIFHTLHLLTTLGEKVSLYAYVRTHEFEPKRALDLQLNRLYWDFVSISWLVLWAVLYIGPRVLN